MKIEQLKQLLTIVEAGSLNEAAKELYVARSSLSSSMRNLESELGNDIFERNSKGVILTEFGRSVYIQAKEICDRIMFLQKTIVEKKPTNLSIASMYCSLANDTFVSLYEKYYKGSFIGNIEESILSDVVKKVCAGLCEIGIVTVFSDTEGVAIKKLEENGLEFHKIIDRKLQAIVGPKNPLYSDNRESVCLKDLQEYPYVVNYASPSDYPWQISLDGRREGAEVQISDLGCALKLIEVSDAYMIDTYDMEAYASLYASRDLKYIPVIDAPLACKLGWVKSANHELSDIAVEFISMLTERAKAAE